MPPFSSPNSARIQDQDLSSQVRSRAGLSIPPVNVLVPGGAAQRPANAGEARSKVATRSASARAVRRRFESMVPSFARAGEARLPGAHPAPSPTYRCRRAAERDIRAGEGCLFPGLPARLSHSEAPRQRYLSGGNGAMERPKSDRPEPPPESDQRRLVLAGLDPLDRLALESLLPIALGATGAVAIERGDLEAALEEVGRGREAGSLTALLVGARAGERELVRLARALGNRSGPIPIVVLLPAALSELVETALSEGCADVLVRGRSSPDDLVRALRCTFEIARRERAEERLRLRLLEPTAPAGLIAEARRFVGLGRTLGATGHDLNNLLQPVLGYCELLLGTLDPETRASHYAQQIDRSARHAADLAGRILAAVREGGQPALAEEADGRLLRSEPLLRWALGVERELELAADAPGLEVRLRDGALEQVLLNLAANARDALPPGGRLVVRTRPEGPATWRLEVEDSGSGISAERLPQVLEPGYTTKPAGKGSGLGLWIVRGLVEEAGGTLTVESVEGRGTTVTVRLPAAARRPAPG
ncbi:MAG: hypothetical protein F9K18_05150 [Thermoanaerobaculia bacterium]|nr:MAG: hypothetical protein F9K18_05150 [Thermoanaerobaculia bacterium]